MKTKPILFNTPMVQAILRGEKAQTRRIVKDKAKPPKYSKGDILYVRESWAVTRSLDNIKPSELNAGVAVEYKAGGCSNIHLNNLLDRGKWRPSIFLPKHLSRIKLRVTNVRSEPLQNITRRDALLEGITNTNNPIESFKALWYSINGKESWYSNPWVYVYEFEVLPDNIALFLSSNVKLTDKEAAQLFRIPPPRIETNPLTKEARGMQEFPSGILALIVIVVIVAICFIKLNPH